MTRRITTFPTRSQSHVVQCIAIYVLDLAHIVVINRSVLSTSEWHMAWSNTSDVSAVARADHADEAWSHYTIKASSFQLALQPVVVREALVWASNQTHIVQNISTIDVT